MREDAHSFAPPATGRPAGRAGVAPHQLAARHWRLLYQPTHAYVVGACGASVTAAGLLTDRRLALTRLRHLGVHVIESEHDQVGERLVQGYVDLKSRGLV